MRRMSVMVPGCLRVGHPAGDRGRKGTGWVFLLIQALSSFFCFPLCPAAFSLCLSLFHPSFPPLLYLSTGVHLLCFTEAHYQFPANLHPQLASQQQHTTTRSKPQEAWQHDWCLPRNSLLLTCVANPSHLCCHYCTSYVVLHCGVVSQASFLLHPKQPSVIEESVRCAGQIWQTNLTFSYLYLWEAISDPLW